MPYARIEKEPIFYDELRAFADYWDTNNREEFRKRLEQTLLVMKVLDMARKSE